MLQHQTPPKNFRSDLVVLQSHLQCRYSEFQPHTLIYGSGTVWVLSWRCDSGQHSHQDMFKALHDSDGASAQYQQLSRELWALDRALLKIELLSRRTDISTELNALRHSARRVVEQCKECLERFLTKAQNFEISLREGGSGNKLRDAAKKIRWALTQTDELARFRAEINGHSSSLNMLLITASM